MVAKNDITGDAIQSKVSNKAFEENVDRIFNTEEKQRRLEAKKKADAEYWAKVNAETATKLAEYELNKSTGEVQKVDDSEKKEVKIKTSIRDVKIKGSL
jgi:DNA-binding sugar fermentation-stimulating protein